MRKTNFVECSFVSGACDEKKKLEWRKNPARFCLTSAECYNCTVWHRSRRNNKKSSSSCHFTIAVFTLCIYFHLHHPKNYQLLLFPLQLCLRESQRWGPSGILIPGPKIRRPTWPPSLDQLDGQPRNMIIFNLSEYLNEVFRQNYHKSVLPVPCSPGPSSASSEQVELWIRMRGRQRSPRKKFICWRVFKNK